MEATQENTQAAASSETTELAPDMIASMVYNELMPVFTARMRDLPKKGQLRVATALMKAPFTNDQPNLSSNAEHAAFTIGLDITDAKAMMLLAYAEKNPDHVTKLRAHFDTIGKRLKETEKANG